MASSVSGGTADDGSGAEDEAEAETASSTGDESSIDDEDCAGWAQAIGEEDRQETAGGRRRWWLFDTVNPNACGAGERGGVGSNSSSALALIQWDFRR